jgi:hypothetical protein
MAKPPKPDDPQAQAAALSDLDHTKGKALLCQIRAVISELAARFRRQKRFWRGSIVRKIGVLH